ncbi:MAG: hypothetical protein QM757_41825 [Paludibaculum sp.]
MRRSRSSKRTRRHYAVISHTYETPWFKGQQGIIGRILGGWERFRRRDAHQRPPLRTHAHQCCGQCGEPPERCRRLDIQPDQRSLFKYFNTAAFARPASWTYGNSGKWVTRGPGSIDLSAFALKNVRVAEKVNLQFRLEAFNALNHMNLGGFNTQLGSSSFGQINDVGTPRYLQIGAKLMF